MKGSFDVNPDTKVYRINLEGFAEPKETEEAVDDLAQKLKAMDVADWSIVIDCRKLSTFKPEILPILERCYKEIYEQFKHAVLINPENTVGRMQLHRVARQCSFTGKFVTTEQEMMNIVST